MRTNSEKTLQCYTIGHSNHPAERFVGLLLGAGIERLVDVRNVPYSKYNPQFNRENLKKLLETAGVEYVFAGDRLGGRDNLEGFAGADGKVDYERAARENDRFRKGMEAFIEKLEDGRRTAIMCAEADPTRCHRFHLVSMELARRGVEVFHITSDGAVETHAQAVERMEAAIRSERAGPRAKEAQLTLDLD